MDKTKRRKYGCLKNQFSQNQIIRKPNLAKIMKLILWGGYMLPVSRTFRVMKLTAFFLLAAFLQVSAEGRAQNLNLSGKNIKLEKVFKEVNKQTDYIVFYNNDLLKNAKPVSINIRNGTVQDVLNACFKDQGLSYSIENKTIVVIRKQVVVTPAQPILIEQPKVSLGILINGKVTDEKGAALAGATVQAKGSNVVGVTGVDGSFSLNVPDNTQMLVISYVGMETQEVDIVGKTNLQIQLKFAEIISEEIVVVGYGKQSKAKVIGAITSVSGDQIRKMPVTNNLQSLAGRIPGLISLTTSGRPGSGASISIRGVSSFNNAPPLYVIDGTIRNGANFAEMDPNEIESISVLRDAGSAAVYGVRATNGVIVITTRKGKIGKPVFSISSSLAFDKPTRFPQVFNAYEFALMRNEAAVNMGNALRFTPQEIEDFRTGKTPSTNWQDVAYGNSAVTQQHNLNVSGGSENVRYFFNLGYLSQNGIYSNLNYSRFNLRANVDIKLNNTLSAAFNLEGKVAKNTAPNVGDALLWQLGSGLNPTRRAYYPDGLPLFLDSDTHPGEVTTKSGYNKSANNLFIGQLALIQQIPFVRGLSAKGSMQIYREYTIGKTFNKQYNVYEQDASGNITNVKKLGSKTAVRENFSNGNSYTLNLSLDYARRFGQHSVTGLLLYEQYQAEIGNFSGSRTNFPFSSVDQLFAGSNDDERSITGNGSTDGRLGVIGRINYDYAAKYLFEFSFRNDASYRFAPNKRWGFFPSVTAGWVLSKEKFLSKYKFIGNLKLRASYGVLGNDIVGGFQWKSSYNVGNSDYYFNESPVKYLVQGVVPNPDLTWESTAITNLALDGSFLNNLFGFTFEVFQKNTYDIYARRNNQLPGVYGASLPNVNYGKVDVRGFEMVLSHENKIGQLRYEVSTNFSFSRNKTRQIDFPENIEPWFNPIGKPLNYTVGYESLGLFQSDAEAARAPRLPGTNPRAGDISYKDQNSDGIIDFRDNKILAWNGSTPEIMYGLNLDAAWKNFSVNVFFQGVGNRKLMYSEYTRNVLLNGNSYKYFLDRWTPENPGAKYPRAWEGRSPVNDVASSFWLKDANFLRLKNVQVTYSLPKKLVSKARLGAVRIFASGVNLAVFSKQKDFDPEFPGGNGFYYPQNKTVTIGANISF